MEQKELDRISYALGLSMGNNFRSSGIDKLDINDFADGVDAVFSGKEPRMTYDEAKEEIRKFFTAMEERQQAQMAEVGKANRAAGEAFLAENAKRPEVKTTATGLQYEIVKEGEGESPKATDSVTVHYTGRLLDGTVFDSSVDRGEPATFGVTQVIPGWVEALQMMKKGAEWKVYIPSDLAYGPNGAGPIPPHSVLIFDIRLINIESK